MKKKQLKQKEVEKANSEIETPGNIDYIEINMTHENLDKVAQKNANILNQQNDPIRRKHIVRRQEKLLRKVFKTASKTLTDKQFKIFVMKYIYGLSNKEISEQFKENVSYAPSVLRASIKKIQKSLRLPVDLTWFSGNYLDETK